MESETVKNLNADFSKYDIEFYDSFSQISYRAALKMLTELRRKFEYSSVVDFGCGSGTWLKAAREVILEKQDIPNLLGIDGEYARKIVDQKTANFLFTNLEERVHLKEKYDLAICLEVAEHLTAARADTFVKDLCEASNMVLFGAAIPGQGGTNHINEQWQTYWHAKFLQNGFVALDLFKNAFWNDATFVDCPYYVTNTYGNTE